MNKSSCESDHLGLRYGPVRQVRIPGSESTVLYASVGPGLGLRSDWRKHQAKRLLLTRLWERFRMQVDLPCDALSESRQAALGHDHLGKPVLLRCTSWVADSSETSPVATDLSAAYSSVGRDAGPYRSPTRMGVQGLAPSLPKGLVLMAEGCGEPAVSFATCRGELWAALSPDQAPVGIDVADPDEFRGSYPFARVFGAEEWHLGLDLASGSSLEAAALLWAAKEAATKALGVGFHFTKPLAVRVEEAGTRTDTELLRVSCDFPLCWATTGANLPSPDGRGRLSARQEVMVAWERVGPAYVAVACQVLRSII